MVAKANGGPMHRRFWRWHFYAGLFVLPFILVLATTGSIYLFKPQIDRWEERAYRDLPAQRAVSPDVQLSNALAADPGATFIHYRLPERSGDAAMIHVALPSGAMRDIYVAPDGKVLGAVSPDERISEKVAAIHGSLLIGKVGDWLVELAASWTIVMILTGLYLWLPRPFHAAGTLYPRLALRGRPLLKDVHRALGVWISGLVLVMLASGLPWAGAWGSAFKWARTELGWVKGPQDWKIGVDGGHAGHHGHAMAMPEPLPTEASQPLSLFVAKAKAEQMPFPTLVLPPHAPQRFGPPTGDVWTAKAEPQNRPLGRQVRYDPRSGAEVGRSSFADQHLLDRIVNTGVAWHEGQLFGLANQLIGLLTAIALIATSLAGVWMWLKRRPSGELGAPRERDEALAGWVVAAIAVMAILLPLFGVSMLAILALDRLGAKSTSSRGG